MSGDLVPAMSLVANSSPRFFARASCLDRLDCAVFPSFMILGVDRPMIPDALAFVFVALPGVDRGGTDGTNGPGPVLATLLDGD